ALRVINEDRVAAAAGFPTHGHRDMEILTYVLAGALEHKDSMGDGAVGRPGALRRRRAGGGGPQSGKNPRREGRSPLLQIWIMPARPNTAPGYEQRAFPIRMRPGLFHLVAAGDGRDGALTIQQDVDLYATVLDPDTSTVFSLRPGRHAWIQVAHGRV